MIELFKNLPLERKKTIENIVINSTVLEKTPEKAASTLITYRNLLPKEEQEFLDFFISFYKEKKKNEVNSN